MVSDTHTAAAFPSRMKVEGVSSERALVCQGVYSKWGADLLSSQQQGWMVAVLQFEQGHRRWAQGLVGARGGA